MGIRLNHRVAIASYDGTSPAPSATIFQSLPTFLNSAVYLRERYIRQRNRNKNAHKGNIPPLLLLAANVTVGGTEAVRVAVAQIGGNHLRRVLNVQFVVLEKFAQF